MGKIHSQTISEAQLLGLTADDDGTVVRDGSGLAGKVHTGKKGISVHFRYRFLANPSKPQECMLPARACVSGHACKESGNPSFSGGSARFQEEGARTSYVMAVLQAVISRIGRRRNPFRIRPDGMIDAAQWRRTCNASA